MKTFFVSLLILLTLNCASQNITPEQAKDNIGKTISVCGKVYGSYHSLKIKGEPTFLDMGDKYPNSTFTVLIWGSDLSKFNYDLSSLEGKNICVSGTIKEYKGKPEMIVTNPSQIKE